MKMIEFNWNPTNRQLRQFSVICLVLIPLVGWLWGASYATMTTLFLIGLTIATVGLVFPRLLAPLYVGLSAITAPIGMVISELALSIVYFVIMAPMGLFFQAIRRDALQLHRDHNAKTYWQRKQRPNDIKSYFRQF